MATTQQIMEERLNNFFKNSSITVIDESQHHKGHLPESILNNGSHFCVSITSKQFLGKSLLERQRMIYDIFHDLLRDNVIHALRFNLNVTDNTSDK